MVPRWFDNHGEEKEDNKGRKIMNWEIKLYKASEGLFLKIGF